MPPAASSSGRAARGVEVLVVHRPRYDDWSFPKGKAEPGESDEDCALREVEEETGLAARSARELPSTDYTDAKGRPKRVRYWAMEVVGGSSPSTHEVDDARWVSVSASDGRARRGSRPWDGVAAAVDGCEVLPEASGEARHDPAIGPSRTSRVGSLATSMSSDYVYTMYRVDKFYGPERQVLSNISLSFLPGAKIGVLGPNGAGKSTLLRIMAGLEEPSSGVAELHPGATVGFLQQEPELDPAKDVRGNVEDGVRELRDLLDRFNAVSAAFAEPDADFDALLAEQAKVQEPIDRHDAWNLDAQLDRAMDALRLPEGDRDVTTLSGGERRRVALCRLLLSSPDLLLLDEPTNHLDAESVAWLERFLEDYKGTVMAVTHDRYFLDNVAGWILELDRGKGLPFEGNYSSWLEQKQARLAGGEDRVGAPPHARARARVGAHEPSRPAREVEGPHHGLREAARRRRRRSSSKASRSTSRRAAARRPRRRRRARRQGLRRPAPRRGHDASRCRRAGSSA